MLDYRIIPAEVAHLLPLAAEMRPADRREVWASNRETPYEALSRSLHLSERAWTAIVHGRPVLIWGVVRTGCVLTDKGSPWLLGTDAVEKYWVEFLRQSRRWVNLMQVGYKRLENYVHDQNRLSIRWLRWCGFELDVEPTIINKEKFYMFWRDA